MDKKKAALFEYFAVILAIISATVLFIPLRSYFAKGQWALFYLLIVVIVGSLRGFRPALIASILAFFSWNYFLIPPYHTFAVDDPKDIIFLFIFLLVGIIVGFQTARLRELGHIKAAHEAEQLKSTLASSVSHELKTPLSSVTAAVTNLLSEGMKWNEKYVRSELECVSDDLDRLNKGINSLLDLSLLETESWKPRKGTYELSEITGVLAAGLQPGQKGRLIVDIPDDFPSLNVDFDQFLRLINIFAENAFNYGGRDAKVAIRAKEHGPEILIIVEDNGPGIPENEKTMVFDKFYRGRTSIKAPSGTGLGLAIAAEIVKYYGGKIRIENVVPHGTRMVISIPKERVLK